MTKKRLLKKNIPKILLIFSMLVIFTFVNINKIKAQENTENWIIVDSYDLNTGNITFIDYESNEVFGTYYYENIWDKDNILPFTLNKQVINVIFRIGDIYEIIYQPTSNQIVINFVKPAETMQYITYNDILQDPNFNPDKLYIYLRQDNNFYYFVDSQENLYKIDKNQTEVLNYTVENISGMTVKVPLEQGNIYKFIRAFNFFHPMSAYSIAYDLGYSDALGDIDTATKNAYELGYNNALRYIDEAVSNAVNEKERQLLEQHKQELLAEYERGFQEGKIVGQSIKNPDYQKGYSDAVKDIDALGKVIPGAIGAIGLFIMSILNINVLGISLWSILAIFAIAGLVLLIIRMVL